MSEHELSDYEKDKQRHKIKREYFHRICNPYIDGNFKPMRGKKLYWGDVLKDIDIPYEYVDEVKKDVRGFCLGAGVKFVEGESGFFGKIFK